MPFQTTWYFKIQICFYIIMCLSLIVSKRMIKRFFAVLLLSFAMIIILRSLSYLTFWWDTALCFSAGFLLAHLHFNHIINKFYAHRISMMITLMILLISYVFTQINCHWIIKICANALFGLAMIIVFSTSFSSRINEKLGRRSLEIYLIHVGLIHLFFYQKNEVSIFYIILYIIVSCIIAYLIHYGQKFIFKENRL